ncbi:MAG: L-2-amino-thiazoline-4-carboxylic acid hydrolase [Lachnospiraceae bacterium]|nr:L-2-amino-thiazoline-4-carboxylic acid hydrolase [Lachnospiraceae bacterium]
MKYTLMCGLYGTFYASACKKELESRFPNENMPKSVKTEYKNIVLRAKSIGNSRLLNAYLLAAYFIALNRSTGLPPEDNYQLLKKGLYDSKLFHKVLGNADSYLDQSKMAGRKAWEKQSHEQKYENDWIVDVLDKTDDYDLGYDYHRCGVCKLCQDEGCFELVQYLCRLDFVMADIMGMRLERTKTIAEGGDFCDFRYSRKLS